MFIKIYLTNYIPICSTCSIDTFTKKLDKVNILLKIKSNLPRNERT